MGRPGDTLRGIQRPAGGILRGTTIVTESAPDLVLPVAGVSPSIAPVPALPAPDTITTAEAVAHELRALGIEHFFLMTGRDNRLWIALESLGIKHILARSEASAVYMADAYARVRNQPTFVYGAYGPGAANVAGALAEAYWSGSPVVALTSSMRRTERYRMEYQELDQPPLFASVTKWGVEASLPSHTPRLVREAARRAASGAPGPVYLGIPNDILEAELPGYSAPADAAVELPLHRPGPTAAEADRVVAALMAAERPLILAGNGIHRSGAYDALRAVAERFGVPVATSNSGKGSIAESHELAIGSVGRYSRKYANQAMRGADVILAVGTGLGGMVTDSYKLIDPSTTVIHVSLDPTVVGLNFPAEIGVVADARTFLEAVLDAADRANAGATPAARRHAAELASQRADWRVVRSSLAEHDGRDGEAMRPEAILAVLERQMADDAIVVADTGYASAWAGALVEGRSSGRTFIRADGSLGWAFPAAMGAQLAAPDRQVFAVTGDGGFGYHVGDIETAIRLGIPTVTIILNNQTLAFEEHVQDLLYGKVVAEVNSFHDVDYGAIASAFGANGFRVTDVDGFERALAVGLERGLPTIIDAVIDRSAIAPVTRYDRVRIREL
jgi:acetolactate synthase-1/2/3 large subunit